MLQKCHLVFSSSKLVTTLSRFPKTELLPLAVCKIFALSIALVSSHMEFTV